MTNAAIAQWEERPASSREVGGSIPASSLHFRTGRVGEAEALVLRYHYSKRVPANVVAVASLHLDGGLFGGDGKCVAAAFFSIPGTRWAEDVIELTRLVRGDDRVPLTLLIARSLSILRRGGHDLIVSFADKAKGHEGFVYRAANFHWHGMREPSMDGLTINGAFYPGRTCNSLFGSRSPDKVRALFPHKTVEPHFDAGKHLYWKALGRRGEAKAARLGLRSLRSIRQ